MDRYVKNCVCFVAVSYEIKAWVDKERDDSRFYWWMTLRTERVHCHTSIPPGYHESHWMSDLIFTCNYRYIRSTHLFRDAAGTNTYTKYNFGHASMTNYLISLFHAAHLSLVLNRACHNLRGCAYLYKKYVCAYTLAPIFYFQYISVELSYLCLKTTLVYHASKEKTD